MNKKITISLLIILMSIGIANAYEIAVDNRNIDYKARCEIIRPATAYREEYSYGNIGVWGVIVKHHYDAELNKTLYWREYICFTPGNPNREKTKETTKTTTITEPTCHEETKQICEETCNLKWKCHHQCWKWINWHWEQECEEECHEETKQICE